MSDQTLIEWCDKTWSPWFGCDKVSTGCKNCYIVTTTPFRVRHLKHGDPRQRGSESYWRQPLKWNRLDGNDHRGMERKRIFPSLCDWLDDEVPIEWLADFLKLIHDTPNLDWLLLTKRQENFRDRVIAAHKIIPPILGRLPLSSMLVDWMGGKPPPNIWIGTSVENQEYADKRIPELLKIPAKVRFLSVEPLLGPVNLHHHLWAQRFVVQDHVDYEPLEKLHWVIVGGESGNGARACNVEWIRDVVHQCKAAGVPCFVKQLGSKPIGKYIPSLTESVERDLRQSRMINHKKGGDPSEWPEDLRVRQFPS